MATRAHLIIKDKDGDERFIYHHWDGYPEGVGKEVREFLHLEEVANIFNAQEFCKAIEPYLHFILNDRKELVPFQHHGVAMNNV